MYCFLAISRFPGTCQTREVFEKICRVYVLLHGFFFLTKILIFTSSRSIRSSRMQHWKEKLNNFIRRRDDGPQTQFTNSFLNRVSDRPRVPTPKQAKMLSIDPPQQQMTKKPSRGSICNHSSAVKEAALRSGRAKMTVRRVVRNDKTYEAFLAFCVKEWCGENPRFLKAVQIYKDMESVEERLKESQRIVDEFFSDKCKHAVSLPAKKLKRLMERSKDDALCGTLSICEREAIRNT